MLLMQDTGTSYYFSITFPKPLMSCSFVLLKQNVRKYLVISVILQEESGT